jgi:biopolymer transport protein ExbD
MITRRSLRAEPSFINLIDVMLTILIIFMMAAPTIQQWVDVNLPSAQVSKAKITEGIVISITKEGKIFIDKEGMDLKDFDVRFTNIWKTRSNEPVFIRADGEVPYKYVINILGITKKLGGENVGLVVEEEKSDTKK